jgi:hypothetical protein
MRMFKMRSFKVYFPDVFKAIVKSIIWLLSTAFFGSLPLLLILLLSGLGIVEADKKANEMYNDLFLIFLSCAIISEISFEGFLCKIKFSKYSYLFFAVSAGVVVGISCILYIIIFLRRANHAKIQAILNYQIVLITYTVLYSIHLKALLFIEGIKIYKKWKRYSMPCS